jgi:hypothetical protein
MRRFKTFTTTLVILITLSCSESKFEEGSETSILLPAESADLSVNELPTQAIEVAATIQAEAQIQEAPTTKSELEKNPLFAECPTEPDRMIIADLYQLAPQTQKLPDYARLKSIKKICLSQLDIKVRNFSEGFPGITNLFEWFSLDMNFIVQVPQDGVYEFKLSSDDGSNLYISDQKVIDNDGIHGVQAKTGSSVLKAGDVNFRVSYFQGPRMSLALELLWKGPNDTEFTYIPKAYLKRPL